MAAEEEVRRMTGVDRLPAFADAEAFRRSMARHHPQGLREAGIGGSVLADVQIDAEGNVTSVAIVPRPAGVRATMVLQAADGTERAFDSRTIRRSDRRPRPCCGRRASRRRCATASRSRSRCG